MSSWEDLQSQYGVGGQPSSPPADRQDVWSQLKALHRIPVASYTVQGPDNSDVEVARRRMVLEMPVAERSLAQLGSGFADVGLGIRQIAGGATPKDADEKRKIDAALVDAPGGSALKFAGNVAPTLGVPFGLIGRAASKIVPKLGPVIEGGVQGGAFNSVQPVGSGEGRLFNTVEGVALGSVAPGVAATYKAGIGSASPETAALARTAIDKYKIPLQASDVTDSKFMKSLNSVYGELPGVGGRVRARQDGKQVAFNRAVGATFGAEGERLTPDVVNSAYGNITDRFNDIYSRNPANGFALNAEIQSVLSRIKKEGTADQQRVANSRIDDLFGRMDETGAIDGNFFNRWQSELRDKAKNDDLLMGLRAAALKAYNKGITGDDAAGLSMARNQYKNYKTVEPLLDKSALGNVSPGLLMGRVASQTNDFARGGGGDLAELSRIGSRFMVDRTEKTGGSMRGLLQNSMIASGVTLPLAAPLQWATNNNIARNAILDRGMFGQPAVRGLLSAPDAPEMISEIMRRSANQGVVGILGSGGLLSF